MRFACFFWAHVLAHDLCLSRAQEPPSALCVLLRRVLPVCTQAAAAERRLAHAQRVQLAATSPHQASRGFVEGLKAGWYQP